MSTGHFSGFVSITCYIASGVTTSSADNVPTAVIVVHNPVRIPSFLLCETSSRLTPTQSGKCHQGRCLGFCGI
ncbi:hypothetical protein XELAEV_18019572mg [Xenopus laevis]|uniref:Uncharacterized protein n=1 Tax=Xenopus laevis TaxID=8355 RepID=A0A974DFI0_XENLA|nr:hypothetical protein XELAEV_18019572mg [Xenopus laevis]